MNKTYLEETKQIVLQFDKRGGLLPTKIKIPPKGKKMGFDKLNLVRIPLWALIRKALHKL